MKISYFMTFILYIQVVTFNVCNKNPKTNLTYQ